MRLAEDADVGVLPAENADVGALVEVRIAVSATATGIAVIVTGAGVGVPLADEMVSGGSTALKPKPE
jgi:hypothetical protein